MKKPKKVKKTWGHELWLANNKEEDYCGKILHIKKGCSTSMHFHSKKHETFYVLSGSLRVEMINTLIGKNTDYLRGFGLKCDLIKQGGTFEINRNEPHKLIAEKGAVEFIEISTFHEDGDSYRISR